MTRFTPPLLAVALTVALLAGCTTAPTDTSAVTVPMKDLKFLPETLTVAPGTTVTWVNEDPFAHTITPTDKAQWGTEGSGDAPADWIEAGESWSFTFEEEGEFPYYCIPHAGQTDDGTWQGMAGKIIVDAAAAPAATLAGGDAPAAAKPLDTAEIGRDAADVPQPIGGRGPQAVTFDITSRELIAEINDGATYEYWTFDGTVPGPMLRVREGDDVTINHHNPADSVHTHNIDFHAVTGPGGGAPALVAAPGETATLTWKALNPGLYIYHCAYQDPPLHIAHGMYGLILVEPAGGLPPVDKEFYVVQGDMYSPFGAAATGHHPFDGDSASDERPSFVVFNGRVGSLQGERQLQAQVGDSIRLFVGNGGPNLVSSFHVIGEIFDRAWDQGGIGHAPQENIQTTLVPAGGAAIVEFDVEVPGDYFLVDHSIYRIHKGAFGVLHVEGEATPGVYEAG